MEMSEGRKDNIRKQEQINFNFQQEIGDKFIILIQLNITPILLTYP